MSGARRSPAGSPADPTVRLLAVLVAVLAAAVLVPVSLAVGIAASSGVAGHGWRVPRPSTVWLGRVLGGHPIHGWFAGLPGMHPSPDSAVLVWLVAGCVYAVAVAVAVLAGRWLLAPWRGGADGQASAGQIRRVLGVGRLHRVRQQIRPDLYPRRRRRAEMLTRRADPPGEVLGEVLAEDGQPASALEAR